MKIGGIGRAKIITSAQLDRLFERRLLTPRDILFAIAYYCACRISEALALTTHDLAGSIVTPCKSTTKGKVATRTLPMHPKLNRYLEIYNLPSGLIFPGCNGDKPLTRASADLRIRSACKRVRMTLSGTS